MEEDLGVREAADRLGVSTRTLRTYLKAGKLPGARQVEGKFGPEHRIPRTDVEVLREELRSQGIGVQGVAPEDGQDRMNSPIEDEQRAAAESLAGEELVIPVTTIVASYQRSVREVGKLQHQLKQLKAEVARLREELMDRETLLAVLQEQKRAD